MNVNAPPRAIPTSAFIAVSLLQSENINLCNTNDEGTAILNSTQSMTNLTFGSFSFIELGIFLFTRETLGQMHNDSNFMYM